MSKLSSILETVSSNYKKGTIDMHLYTDDKPIVTFKENDKVRDKRTSGDIFLIFQGNLWEFS